MKIWFDADNGPHVLIMKPLYARLSERGHDVVFTARDRTSTCELLDLYGMPYRKVGGMYADGFVGKVMGTLGRAMQLVGDMKGAGADVSFGHGSRALPIASRLLGVPTVTMYDYEWVDPRLFNLFCRTILMPGAVGEARCAEAGISVPKVHLYRGLKEELYLADREEGEDVAAALGLKPDAVKVLLRPPATTAHYHNPESEKLLAAVLDLLSGREDLQLVLLPRTPDQLELVPDGFRGEVIVPDRVFDGPTLIDAMDMVFSGGGTMTREAAVLGVPSYSFFRGREGNVDAWLVKEGYLTLLTDAAEVPERVEIRHRSKAKAYALNAGLVDEICDVIEAAAG